MRGDAIHTPFAVPPSEGAAVEIAEGVKVRVVRSTIATVLSKTEPAAANK